MRTFGMVGLLLAAIALPPTGPASANTIAVGSLKCEVSGSIAFVVRSTRELHCVFYKWDGQNEA